MKNWQTSLYGQIAYMGLTGAGLLLMPQVVTSLLKLGPSEEIWVRLLGALAIVLCLYYHFAVKNDARWFAKISVWGRYVFCAAMAALALIFDLPMFIALAVLEGGLAAWTHWTLGQAPARS